ncbi:hypothetical protein ACJJTC_012213 [Scirpophaga incertulas]
MMKEMNYIKKKPTAKKKTFSTNNHVPDNNDLKKIPFNIFVNSKRQTEEKKRTRINSYPTGLSPKEKSYVISNCQRRSSRYSYLKSFAKNAIKSNKIFSIQGKCSAIRQALVKRGWVEKLPPKRMNLSKIRNGTITDKITINRELERLLLSNFVNRYNPNFIWQGKDKQNENDIIDMTKECNAIINKIRTDASWTTKQGLCSALKKKHWFFVENVAEVNCPRTYNSYDVDEVEEFVNDYKITACTSLLKWILRMTYIGETIYSATGKISTDVLLFAFNRCKEYLYCKQHRDIDESMKSTTPKQWTAFLTQFYRIISKQDIFHTTKDIIDLYLDTAKIILSEILKYRTQLSCEGYANVWILKPADCSRGRGIRMASVLTVINSLLTKTNVKYVIQKYIEEPLLIHDTKFDIRQYYLVTSTYPLQIWMYRDCYLKFSSQKYNLKKFHEAIHLTNNAIQRQYKNSLERNPELPSHNMWHLNTYKDYLETIGKYELWDSIVYPGMKKGIIAAMLCCQDSLTGSKNQFGLYGCDFILDNEYKPWLIEINSCPDLSPTTLVTAKICPAVISDIVKVVIDYASDSKASTGKFERIYRETMKTHSYGGVHDLIVRGVELPMDYSSKGKTEAKENKE